MTLGTWIGGGGCTVISTALGAKDTEKAKSASAACTLLSLASGVLLGGAALLFPTLPALFRRRCRHVDYTAQYLQILALGTPVVVFSNVFANLVRAEGAVQVAVMLNMLGTVTNIILDPLFISGLNLGVQGAPSQRFSAMF